MCGVRGARCAVPPEGKQASAETGADRIFEQDSTMVKSDETANDQDILEATKNQVVHLTEEDIKSLEDFSFSDLDD
ncbi:hypothetical protein H696_04385 [Fonticula alba]|uniref:Uncharacterized protein n=1 Tax=Fonticula alba TaxID=691883 RepID=A0A058Z406_FONAL|nr:hypothetical protein H696_04385 [Fonticula alba]KCV68965.1 hypothetical protein H696_04385 [Fonticula alba]|eukprot:XP_009496536.1 hypothetical protein H696_04385 [Fonticula alba]